MSGPARGQAAEEKLENTAVPLKRIFVQVRAACAAVSIEVFVLSLQKTPES